MGGAAACDWLDWCWGGSGPPPAEVTAGAAVDDVDWAAELDDGPACDVGFAGERITVAGPRPETEEELVEAEEEMGRRCTAI